MIDGANLIQQIMTVEWPAIKDMVVIQFILQAGNIMSIGFEKAYALQTDLNLNTAEIIATYVYKKGLLDGDYSFSTAVGLFNTVVNVILLIAVNKVVAKMNDGKACKEGFTMAKQKKSKMALYTRQDKIILYCGYALLGLFLLAIIVPMIYIVIASFMDPVTLQNKGISFDFSKWSLDAYQRVVSDKQIWVGFRNAVLYSIIFTIISVAVTMLAAYPMSLPDFKGKKIFNTLFVITMFFSGGLIPTYLLINNLGLLDSMWAVILPGAFSVWNMIIARTYYQGIPRELREAADVDGASEMLYFFKILLPVCMPVVAVLALWQFVAMWNSYFDAMIYLNSASKQPLQLVLRSILIQSQPESGMIADIQSTAERAKMAELLKYATIIISSLPLLVMYPFFQKYFDAGIMAGSIKG